MKNKKVLLVGMDLVVGMRSILDKRTNLEIIHTFQGGKGLELITREKPDLVIMDLFLSDVNALYIASVSRCIYRYENKLAVVLCSSDAGSLFPIIGDFLSANKCSLLEIDTRENNSSEEVVCQIVCAYMGGEWMDESGKKEGDNESSLY